MMNPSEHLQQVTLDHCESTDTYQEEKSLVRQIALTYDSDAFNILSERYSEPLRRFLIGHTNGNHAAAEDILQETLLRLWTRASTFDGHGSVHSWLFRIAANLAANYRRTIARRRESSEIPVNEETDELSRSPEEELFRSDQNGAMRRLINELPEETRELLRLVHDEEWNLRDVATTLGIPEGTVKSRLYHTRRKLARQWEAEER